ncbi:hypothetical protein A2U01_0105066, partial [Trifolium medium]|nr:hypothetical protein [Trifolium medium]
MAENSSLQPGTFRFA